MYFPAKENLTFLYFSPAKKLPKSDTTGTPQQRQQSVRLNNEQGAQQSEGGCCK
jgi:hypothetical protein